MALLLDNPKANQPFLFFKLKNASFLVFFCYLVGVTTIGKGLITIFLICIVYLGIMPTVSNLAEDESLWTGVTDSRALFLRDNAMLIFCLKNLCGWVDRFDNTHVVQTDKMSQEDLEKIILTKAKQLESK